MLGLGAIEKRPAGVDDEICIRHYLENFEAWILA
ncbi:MAG: hypothetical protein ACYTF8_07935 [Planctomycetota bacterium]